MEEQGDDSLGPTVIVYERCLVPCASYPGAPDSAQLLCSLPHRDVSMRAQQHCMQPPHTTAVSWCHRKAEKCN